MTYNDNTTDAKAKRLYQQIQPPTEDQNRKAVRQILAHAENAEQAASLLAMLDLHNVAEDMLAERENDLGGDAA